MGSKLTKYGSIVTTALTSHSCLSWIADQTMEHAPPWIQSSRYMTTRILTWLRWYSKTSWLCNLHLDVWITASPACPLISPFALHASLLFSLRMGHAKYSAALVTSSLDSSVIHAHSTVINAAPAKHAMFAIHSTSCFRMDVSASVQLTFSMTLDQVHAFNAVLIVLTVPTQLNAKLVTLATTNIKGCANRSARTLHYLQLRSASW